ncbi:MAG: hypothetical protein ACLFP4_03670 [Spirochaetales bacterium]
MKAAVRLLVRFILWFGLLLLVVSTFVVAYQYVSGYDPQADASTFPLLALYVKAALDVIFPILTFAAVTSLFDIVREGDTVAIPLAVLCVAWSGFLVAGAILLSEESQEAPRIAPALPIGRIVRGPDLSLYAERRSADTYSPMVISEPGHFRWAEQGRLVTSEEAISLPELQRSISLEALSNSYPAMVRVPVPLRRLTTDIVAVNAFFRGRPVGDLPASAAERGTIRLNLAGLSVFLLGLWTLARLTRWPLFNIVFALAAWRFAFWLIPAVMTGPIRPLVVAAFGSSALATVSALVLGGIGVLLFAAGALLPPLHTSQGASR